MGTSKDQFTYAMELVTSISLSMVLVNVIKLRVLEAIAEAGPDAQLSAHEIASRLLILNQDAPTMLDRMLWLLGSHSIVTCTQRDKDSKLVRAYGLTPLAKFLIPNQDGVSLGPLMEILHDKVFLESWFKLKDSVVGGGVPFNMVHGAHEFEYLDSNTRFNNAFNGAMVNHSSIVIKKILECYNGFDNLTCVVDVGGGLGVTLSMIVSKYPTIKGINFDLPHVTQHAPEYPGIKHVAGDMFDDVPRGDAIFMKWILHCWNDDHCVKLLKNCYKSLPDDGKIIVVEAIIPFLPESSSSTKVTTNIDVLALTLSPEGKERTEDEFLALAKDAGFIGIRKQCFVCNFWVMEFYK